MEVNILKKEKNEIEFEMAGEDSTLPALLVHKLNEYPGVDFAAYKEEHPLIKRPKLTVRVKRGDPAKTIEKALKELSAEVADFRTQISKLK
jgi:DNA-directed RNA polymerase subunit L